MIKLVMTTGLNFSSKAELIKACMDCIYAEELKYLEDEGIPQNWENPKIWTDEIIQNFLIHTGSILYEHTSSVRTDDPLVFKYLEMIP